MSAPRFTRQAACAMAGDILLKNAVDASIVAFWRKGDNDFGAVTCRPTFRCFAVAMGRLDRDFVALPASDNVSTFRGDGVEPDVVALAVADHVLTFRDGRFPGQCEYRTPVEVRRGSRARRRTGDSRNTAGRPRRRSGIGMPRETWASSWNDVSPMISTEKGFRGSSTRRRSTDPSGRTPRRTAREGRSQRRTCDPQMRDMPCSRRRVAFAEGGNGGNCGVAKWGKEGPRIDRRVRCLACGAPMQPTLIHVGSLRCLECRAADQPLDPTLAEPRRQARSPARWLAEALGRRLLGVASSTDLSESQMTSAEPSRMDSGSRT